MAKNIYVGNLSYTVTEDDIREAFGKIGEIQSVRLIKDNVTGRSKGFGFVEMGSDEDADRAIATLNGTMLMDRAINVSEARPQTNKPRPGGGGGMRRPGGGGGKSFGSRGDKGTGRWR
ncbi:MAG: RNA-binding protein [Nitrospiraceae bacterium]|nr:RNA-binding protein [Nitrospiraceae bacterium]